MTVDPHTLIHLCSGFGWDPTSWTPTLLLRIFCRNRLHPEAKHIETVIFALPGYEFLAPSEFAISRGIYLIHQLRFQTADCRFGTTICRCIKHRTRAEQHIRELSFNIFLKDFVFGGFKTYPEDLLHHLRQLLATP